MLKENEIYLSDCLDVMSEIPDKSIDLVLIDSPYGIGKNIENDSLSDDDMIILWNYYFVGLYNKLKDNANLLIEVPKNKNFYWNCFKRYNFEYTLFLYTTNGMRQCKVGYNTISLVLWFSKGKGKIYKRYIDKIDANFINTNDLFKFPCPKNIEHYSKLIKMFSKENDLIFDGFAGSGTTALARIELNRRFICVEKDVDYYNIARKRIEDAKSQLRLF